MNSIIDDNKKKKFEEFKQKFINKLLKIVTVDNRILIGKLESVDKPLNFYFTDVVEVFDKQSDLYFNWKLFSNSSDTVFDFQTNGYSYQIYAPIIIAKNQIKSLSIYDQ